MNASVRRPCVFFDRDGLALDFEIMFKTLGAIFRGTGY